MHLHLANRIFYLSFLLSESTDPEFDSNQRSFAEMEKAAEKLLKDAKTFSEAVTCASNTWNEYLKMSNSCVV